MSTQREAILRGTSAAAMAHDSLRLREQMEPMGLPIDVFGIIDDLGLPLLFRPIDPLLGACVRVSEGRVGIMITTERDLHLQRFTAAHELGHFLLEHQGSLDHEVGVSTRMRGRDPQEIEADAFASEFLMPSWLCRSIAARRNWTTDDLRDPHVLYQMSLRMAVSYEAACWGLAAQNVFSYNEASKLADEAPKKLKTTALEGAKLEDPWADVWLLDEHDDGAILSAGPTDVLVVSLVERAGSGYLWDTSGLAKAGFQILNDQRDSLGSNHIGGPTRRKLILATPSSGIHRVSLAERRPWAGSAPPLKTFSLVVSSGGREHEGLFNRPSASTSAFAH